MTVGKITVPLMLTALLFAVSFGVIAFGQTQPMFLWGEGRPMFTTIAPDPTVNVTAGAIPSWTGSFKFGEKTYPFTMIGTDPAAGSQSTVVPTEIIPIRFVFGEGNSLDPTAPVCGGTKSAVQLVLDSPVFQSATFTPGGTDVGTTQYVDAFQRANFWDKVSTTSPGYHVLLGAPVVMPVQTIVVPKSSGTIGNGPCARVGKVSMVFFYAWLIQHVQNNSSTSFPIFLTYNTFFTQNGSCCILGFHTAFGLAPNGLTTGVAAYSDAGIFNVPIQDIHALSHEVGEWMDDPFGTNFAPRWNGGQVSGCSFQLEVGDPVTGKAFQVTMNGTTYNPEDLVFLSWFARQTPSTAVNGLYTFLNNYSTPPAVCREPGS